MNPDGSVAFSATYDGSEHPSSREVIDFLVKEHKNLADQNKIKVSAIAYDACVPIAGKKTDCIIMNLEHQSGYSVTVGMPYSFSFFKKVKYQELFAMPGSHDIFEEQNPAD